jgi:nitrite reductase/ring-hydroxylating ferredoxin subunit
MKPAEDPNGLVRHCGDCAAAGQSRRDILAQATGALVTALLAAGVEAGDAAAMPVAFAAALRAQGAERSYPIPPADGATIDRENEIILVRQAGHVFAFALACPHENVVLRWRQVDQRFQCPRHESKYKPDGTFIEGRATRNMDRFAVRRDGANVVVNLTRFYQSDQQPAEWNSAAADIR